MNAVRALYGTEVLSAFRVQRLLEKLAPRAPGLTHLRVLDLFLVQSGGVAMGDLRKLLGPGPDALPAASAALFVVPRLGTVSPWSSKATDIARVCGLAVSRIERGRVVLLDGVSSLAPAQLDELHDRMTESVVTSLDELGHVLDAPAPRVLRTVDVKRGGVAALERANKDWGLALSGAEMEYLAKHFASAGRDPTDAELMMFAQINSEHCRHKIFNGEFTLDGEKQDLSLFDMIKLTYQAAPQGVLSAYTDNAAVIEGFATERFIQGPDHVWGAVAEPAHILMKVETHNHPTGISPHPGAATGSGGEIRDEAATGRGAKPKAGLCGFSVSHLRIPDFEQPWEFDDSRPERVATPLSIMLEGPIGAAAYNNEFGRPNLAGYFRTFETREGQGDNVTRRGYHKPIMIAGGLGNVRPAHVQKQGVTEGAKLVVLGGPAMLIGLGGGAASSMTTGASTADLDFASVQRANPELQRRCQEVVDACWALGQKGENNPIQSIHDVGAGGLSNAIPELLHDSSVGGVIDLDTIPSDDPSLSPLQLWCNESQERYVMGIHQSRVAEFAALCARERCPFAVVGTATAEERLVVGHGARVDAIPADAAINLPMDVLFGKAPKMHRDTAHPAPPRWPETDTDALLLRDAGLRVLSHPTVASKSFLITIGDRTVGGLTARDQMVGPWQLPVADCAITLSGFDGNTGEAMAIGERTPLALLDAGASARMAVGEAITNLIAAPVESLNRIKLSANWMAAAGHAGEDARLFDAVRAIGIELCPELELGIPVGKDSLSMQAQWQTDGELQKSVSPVSLVVTAFAPVVDVRQQLTPLLQRDVESELWLIGLGGGLQRLGGSILSQCHPEHGATSTLPAFGGDVPDLDDPQRLRGLFELMREAREDGLLLAYHDRSDGGAFAALCEMAFASHMGLDILLDGWGDGRADDVFRTLFNEELGAIVQVPVEERAAFADLVSQHGLIECAQRIARPTSANMIRVSQEDKVLAEWRWEELFDAWWSTSHALQRLRDNPECADQERDATRRFDAAPMTPLLTFNPSEDVARPFVLTGARPKVAILREQGVNSQIETAVGFDRAGFDAFDVHMSDLIAGRSDLRDFSGVVACGGFSYGDVLGAGRGWATSILERNSLRDAFAAFFDRSDTFSLGICNGCQMMAQLRDIIPGAEHWPTFQRNLSEQYEARLALLEVGQSPSLFLRGMTGSRIPVAVAHGEGRAVFANGIDQSAVDISLRYVTGDGRVAERYPANPNGSPGGIAGVTSRDGRATILMPHAERTLRSANFSWAPQDWPDESPWLRMFRNARVWLG